VSFSSPPFSLTLQFVETGRPFRAGSSAKTITLLSGDLGIRSPTTTSGVPTIRDSHTTAVKAGTPGGNAPLTIFVIDRLNSSFDDFAYIRDQLRRYLKAQPKRLN
jgi:hypothetical protein